MSNDYVGVTTRFLKQDERLILSEESEMPFVIEAQQASDVNFLKNFLSVYSTQIRNDISRYGAVLLRGFDVASDEDFENTVLSIQGLRGISEAFMSEHGRIHVGHLKYVLHTNAVYKTGGTLYLGGFHSENYYSTDVPTYISFCCLKPSAHGGETGLVNMEKVYQYLAPSLKEKLEAHTCLAAKWLVSEVAKRYQISTDKVEEICKHFDLPIIGTGEFKFILMYKPNVFEDAVSKKKSLQINLFELPTLNKAMRNYFMADYHGRTWFWHRFVWRFPEFIFKFLEYAYMTFASLFYSPKNALKLFKTKLNTFKASSKYNHLYKKYNIKVASCFNADDINTLAKLIRNYYSSCLWKKGDILLVDNRKVVHAGMPGAGPRLIRAMICNPIDMKYTFTKPGYIDCKSRTSETVGYYMKSGHLNVNKFEPEMA